MNTELLPCPFCGGTNLFKSQRYDQGAIFRVGCLVCNVAVEHRDKNTAVDKWNYRAHQQAIEAAVLAEREACAQLCNDMHSLRGANADHKYMADKCAMHIRARTQPMRIDDAHKED